MPSALVVDPTVKLPTKMGEGVLIVLQAEPSFPAEATTTTPAARRLSTAFSIVAKLVLLQPSDVGHPQELLITWGAFFVSGFLFVKSVGARKNSKHST